MGSKAAAGLGTSQDPDQTPGKAGRDRGPCSWGFHSMFVASAVETLSQLLLLPTPILSTKRTGPTLPLLGERGKPTP